MASDASMEVLRRLVQTHPLIDNHAHNILHHANALDYARFPLELIISEAEGAALEQARAGLPYLRAVDQLASLFRCDAKWDAIKAAREAWLKQDYLGLVRKCLEGTHMLLLDDLLVQNDVEPYSWHDQFTAASTKRIVRIEAVASKILASQQHLSPGAFGDNSITCQKAWRSFCNTFEEIITEAIQSPDVVAFKSVICYRTGLDIDSTIVEDQRLVLSSFIRTIQRRDGPRIEDKAFNDWLVIHTLELLRSSKTLSGVQKKPIQFHTGLGDSDIDLHLANPAYLQFVIAKYPDVDFVLLHSSYPYTRQAGYLATVYPNAYLDLGEVFPMLSRDGQESIIRQSFENTPASRLLWSTDGHFHPESFWLSNKQFRDGLEKVLVDYVMQGDFDLIQAMKTAADILFNNSNRLYGLGQVAPDIPIISPPVDSLVSLALLQNSDLDGLLRTNPGMFIWIQWVDYTATVRARMFPIREFIKIVRNQRRIGISSAARHMLQNDYLVPEGSPTGQFYMRPDLSSFCRNAGLSSNSASVMSFWLTEDGHEVEGCPRTTLRDIEVRCRKDHGFELAFGFEIEVVFLKPIMDERGDGDYVPITQVHSWSNVTTDIRKVLPIIEEVVTTLTSIGIEVEQFHAESSAGQFEFILPADRPLAAVDRLIRARQTISHVAEKHGLRATLHPRPNPMTAGTASHAHFSISPATHEESFLAGILEHLPAVLAFTLSNDASYGRVAAGIWAGGEWVAWGTQNREMPIRKISAGHWEMKCLDGLSNMYFAMAALVAAGYLGVSAKRPLGLKDCTVDAATLTTEERSALGITTPLPKTLAQSLAALGSDEPLQELLGKTFVKHYSEVKRAESAMLTAMEEAKRRKWLIERY